MQIARILAVAVQIQMPVLVIGEPGVGKTATMYAIARALGWHLEVVIASIREPSDFSGFPSFKDVTVGGKIIKGTSLAAPDWALRCLDTSGTCSSPHCPFYGDEHPVSGPSIILFDEISTAPPAVQAALLRPVFEGVVGEVALPRVAARVAAANPAEMAAGGWDLCVTPETRILRRDLTWVTAGALAVGDDLVGIDEFPTKKIQRRLRPATVKTVGRRVLECVRVITDKGTLTVTREHPFLVRVGTKTRPMWGSGWVPAGNLKPGDRIRFLVEPWRPVSDLEGKGYLAAAYDGEGWIQTQKGRLGFSQNPGAMHDRVRSLLTQHGFAYKDRKATASRSRVRQVEIQDMGQALRFLGQVRPVRLMEQSDAVWAGRTLPHGTDTPARSQDAVVLSVIHVGKQEVVSFETNTHTFIAEGLVSHNTAPLANRFIHLPWKSESDEWIEGSLAGWPEPKLLTVPTNWLDFYPDAITKVVSFIRAKRQLLQVVPDTEEAKGRAWPSRRTWTMAARILAACNACHADDGIRIPLIAGCVGEGPGLEFVNWLKHLNLPNPEDLIHNPEKFKLPPTGDQQFTILASVATYTAGRVNSDSTSKTEKEKIWRAAWKIMGMAAQQNAKDIAAAAAKTLANLKANNMWLPLPKDDIKEFVPLMRQAGMLD